MKFIVLGDLHYTDYPTEPLRTARDHFFETLFHSVATQNADLVFAIGDIVHDGTHSEIQGLYTLARRCGVELLSITGNHDTASLPKADLRPYFVGGQAGHAELYTAFSNGGVRFVLLDTGREMLCDVDWSGYVSPEQQSWLADQIEAYRQGATDDQALVVLGHHPFYDTTTASSKDRLNIANSQEVRPLLGQASVGRAMYICGHNHVNSLFGPDEAGWTFIQCGAPLVAFSYRLISFDEQGSRLETVDFGLGEAGFKESLRGVYAGLQHFSDIDLARAAGPEADRTRHWAAMTTLVS